jgi:3-methyladenine DNA glycosylase AlkD
MVYTRRENAVLLLTSQNRDYLSHRCKIFSMDPVIIQMREELKFHGDPKIQKTSQRFFKEEITCYGVKTKTVHEIARKYWTIVKRRPKPELFTLCEELFLSGYLEESFIVSNWTHALANRYEPEDLAVFQQWIERYITNWASCDSFCNHTIGDFLEKFPAYINELIHWTQSDNRWMRRASAVSLIIPAKHGKFFKEAIEITDLLLKDGDDMVQKGYGWLLKESSRKHQNEVFNYIMKNKKNMPRTALRYAIELMPGELKSEAMKRK